MRLAGAYVVETDRVSTSWHCYVEVTIGEVDERTRTFTARLHPKRATADPRLAGWLTELKPGVPLIMQAWPLDQRAAGALLAYEHNGASINATWRCFGPCGESAWRYITRDAVKYMKVTVREFSGRDTRCEICEFEPLPATEPTR